MKRLLAVFLLLTILFGGCASQAPIRCSAHQDSDNNGICDICAISVYIYFDFYAINDLHGKLADGANHPGVDELTTYLKKALNTDTHAIFLSAGDMWQGSAESNTTKGRIITDWMNELNFTAMALGNHEFDWGEEFIESNSKHAEFPLLAINVYDRQTNARADYCDASVVVEGSGLQIGIIGAIGDCYSSISADKTQNVYFKTGKDLTDLVMTESTRLRAQGVDFIVYLLHDGYSSSHSGAVKPVTNSQISSYYDTILSNGYVDLVFEGHTHQGYRLQDEYGVYHLQNRGDNKGGISHVEVAINSVTNDFSVHHAELVSTQRYETMYDDPIVEDLLDKYKDDLDHTSRVLGYNSVRRDGNTLRQLCADLYYEAGVKKWGSQYELVLGGGYFSVRSPGNLSVGDVTYGQLQSLFPFDNQLVLCSIAGRDLKSKFFETSNSNYFIGYGDYGEFVRKNIDPDGQYYLVTDTYSAYYAPNKLTVVAEYDDSTFARDLLADYIADGGLSRKS